MSDTDKIVWVEKAYSLGQELEEMNGLPNNLIFEKKGNILNKNETQMRDRVLGKPKAPPGSAYDVFFRKMMHSEEISEIPNMEKMKWISQCWKKVSDSEKKSYESQIKGLREEYKQKYAEFLESLDPSKRDEIDKTKSKFRTKRKSAKKIIESHHSKDDKYEIESLTNSRKSEDVSEAEVKEEVKEEVIEEVIEEVTIKKKKKNKHLDVTDAIEIISENVTERKKKEKKNTHSADETHQDDRLTEFENEEMVEEIFNSKQNKKKKKKRNSVEDIKELSESILNVPAEGESDLQDVHSNRKKKKKKKSSKEIDYVPELNESILNVLPESENEMALEEEPEISKRKKNKKKKRISTEGDEINNDYVPDNEERSHKKKKKKHHVD